MSAPQPYGSLHNRCEVQQIAPRGLALHGRHVGGHHCVSFRGHRALEGAKEPTVACCSSKQIASIEEAQQASQPVPLDAWQVDTARSWREEWTQLQEVCSGALEMLEQLLKSRESWKHVHAAVYCRRPETFQTGELLFELANNMDLVGEDSKTEVNSTLLLGNAEAESFLARRFFLELPHKACSVFPLTRGLHVVGLLLLVLEQDGMSPIDCKASTATEEYDAAVVSKFMENDLDVLQSIKKLLTSACDLYQSAILMKEMSSARNKMASGLLMETKAPVKLVRSMANMLYYRVEEGNPERDMVQNIQDQGARLSEVVKQLEAALHMPGQGLPYSQQLPAFSTQEQGSSVIRRLQPPSEDA